MPDTDTAKSNKFRFITETVFNIITTNKYRKRQIIFAHKFCRNTAIPPSRICVLWFMNDLLATKHIFNLSGIYSVFQWTVSSLMIHKSYIFIQEIHLFIEKHCATDKMMLIFRTNDLQKIIGTDKALRKNHNIIIHQKNMGRFFFMIHSFQHTSCKSAGTTYIKVRMYHYMLCLDLFCRKCPSIIYHMDPQIFCNTIITGKYSIFQKLNVRKDIIFFFECCCTKMKRYMTHLIFLNLCSILASIDHTYTECMDLEAGNHQIIFRIFKTDLLLLSCGNLCSAENFTDVLCIFLLIACKKDLHLTFYTQFQNQLLCVCVGFPFQK